MGMNDAGQAPAVNGASKYLLRAEGFVVLALAAVLFWRGGYSWVLFALLFLVPDISMSDAARHSSNTSLNAGTSNSAEIFSSRAKPLLLRMAFEA